MLHRPRRWAPIYLLWIAFCAVLFVALRGAEDPSRPEGRILSIDAGRQALALARARGLNDYEVVHVARAREGEGADTARWIVLLDKVPRTALEEAVVFELAEDDGRLLRARPPEPTSRRVDEPTRKPTSP